MARKVCEVIIAATVGAATPDEAVGLVRGELAMKLGEGGAMQLWQAKSVRGTARVDGTGAAIR